MNDIERFSFFKSYGEAIERFKYEESKKEMLFAIYNFMYFDLEPSFSKRELELKELAWIGIRANLSASKNKSKNAKRGNQN